MISWSLQEAEARLEELVANAPVVGPQEITDDGKPVAVLMTVQEYERKVDEQSSVARATHSNKVQEAT